MARLLAILALASGLLASVAFAAEKTLTLAVENMTCAACPYTVKRSLSAVPGVSNVVVSYEHKTAVVTYDDAKTNVQSLMAATTNAGYPSALKD